MASTRSVLTGIVLLVILVTPPAIESQPNRVEPLLTIDWWDPEFRFRIPIQVTNNLAVNRTQIPIFSFIEVEKGSILSSRNEFRVIQDRVEVPSFILYENVEDGLVVGVYFFFTVDLIALESQSIFLYYGNPNAKVPGYRIGTTVDDLEFSTNLDFDEENQNFMIEYAGLYDHTLSLLVEDSTSTFSSGDLNSTRFEIVSDWADIGLSNLGFESGRVILRGQSLLLVISGVWSEDSIWLSSLVTNIGSTGTGLTSITSLLDFSGLISLGPPEGHYDTLTDSFQVGVAGTWFGIGSRSSPSSFDVVNATEARTIAQVGGFRARTLATEDVALVSKRNLGFLAPGEQNVDILYWSIGGSRILARESVLAMRDGIGITILPLELPDTPIPVASLIYRNTVEFKNVSFPSTDFQLSVDPKDSLIVPTVTNLDGNIIYRTPDRASSGFEESNFWEELSEVDSGLVYSSASHLTAERGRVARLWAVVSEEGTANVSLTSQSLILSGIFQSALNFSYRTSYSQGSEAFAEFGLNLDYDGDGTVDERFIFPVEGLNHTESTIFRTLSPNDQWNQMYVELGRELSFDNVRVWMDVQVNVTSGSVQLSVDDVYLELHGDASRVLIASASGNVITIKRIGTELISDIVGDIEIAFQSVTHQMFSGGAEARFQTEFATPEVELSEPTISHEIRTEPYYAFIHTSRPSSIELITVNDRPIPPGDAIRVSGLVVLDRSALNPSANAMKLEYIFGRLQVEALDIIGEGASDLTIIASDGFGRFIVMGKTGGDGEETLHLAPSTYQVELFYHNESLGSRRVVIDSDVNLRAEVSVYNVRLRVIDRFRLPVENATISVLLSNSSIGEALTGASGIAIFNLIGQKEYRVIVEHSGELIYDSDLQVNLYGSTLDLETQIIPPWTLPVVGVLLVLPVVGIIVYGRSRGR